MSTATTHLRSLSQLCSDIGVAYRRLVEVIRAERIEPAMTLDGTPFYDDAADAKIRAAIVAKAPTDFKARIVQKGAIK